MNAHDRKVYALVLLRDKGCVAPLIDQAEVGQCGPADVSTPRTTRFDPRNITREHVRPLGGSMGGRRITELWAIAILCAWHHLGFLGGRNWALRHKDELRRYLAGQHPERAYDLLGKTA